MSSSPLAIGWDSSMFYCLCEAAQQAFSDPVERKTSAARSVVYKMARRCTNGAESVQWLPIMPPILRGSRCEAEVKSSNMTYTTKLTKPVAASERSSETPTAVLASVLQALAPLLQLSTARDRAESVSVSFWYASSAAKQLPYRAALRHTQQTPRSSFTSRLQQTDCSTDHAMRRATRRIGARCA